MSLTIREQRQDERLDNIERQLAELRREFQSLVQRPKQIISRRDGFLNELDTRLDEEDARDLAFAVQVEFDNLPARNKRGKLRELINELESQNRLYEMIGWLQRHYPQVEWPTLP